MTLAPYAYRPFYIRLDEERSISWTRIKDEGASFGDRPAIDRGIDLLRLVQFAGSFGSVLFSNCRNLLSCLIFFRLKRRLRNGHPNTCACNTNTLETLLEVVSSLSRPSWKTAQEPQMNIVDAQREVRFRFSGGFYGQAVAGLIWLVSASLASWGSPQTAISTLVVGGFFIFPITELLIRTVGTRLKLDSRNLLPQLGMQVAFVLPLSMPLLLPVSRYHLNWFYPALMILLGAHYLPFVFLYGMRMFAVLAASLLGGGVIIAMYLSSSFSIGAWYTGIILLIFAVVGKSLVRRERERNTTQPPPVADGV